MWKKIETAPKDGTRILVLRGDSISDAWWDGKGWLNAEGYYRLPKYWTECPEITPEMQFDLSPEQKKAFDEALLKSGKIIDNGRILTPHVLYKDGDQDAPDAIKDRNGEVVLNHCRNCGRGEIELVEQPHCDQRRLKYPEPPKPQSNNS